MAAKPIRVPSPSNTFVVCSACSSMKTQAGAVVRFNCANAASCKPTGCTKCECTAPPGAPLTARRPALIP